MTFNTGTATDYLDLLDQLVQIATARNVATAAVNAGGTGYAVDDILTVLGGTSTHVATIRVTSVAAGVIDGVRMETGGAYTADPSTTANAVTGGTGTGATMDLTMADTGWTERRRTQQAASATVGSGGTGYTVGDDITIAGGLQGHGGVSAVFNVDSVSGGVVTAVSLVTAGNYEEVPANPAATTGGTGTGCTLNVTSADAVAQNQVLILEGEGLSALDAIVVGIKTWNGSNAAASATTYNWALFGMSGYNAGLKFHEQVDISPGLNSSTGAITSSTNVGAFVPLKTSDAFDIEFWISVTPRRILGIAKVETASLTRYMGFHLGFLNQLGTTSEFAYPLYIAGSTNRLTGWYQDTTSVVSGLTELVGLTGGSGPAYAWDPNGAWVSFRNATVPSDVSLSVTASTSDNTVYPAGRTTAPTATEDQITAEGTGFDWTDIIFLDGAGALELYSTPGSQHPLIPCIVTRTDIAANPDAFLQLGEVDGLTWLSAAEGESAEDEIVESDDTRHVMFYNGNRNTTYSYCALRED